MTCDLEGLLFGVVMASIMVATYWTLRAGSSFLEARRRTWEARERALVQRRLLEVERRRMISDVVRAGAEGLGRAWRRLK